VNIKVKAQPRVTNRKSDLNNLRKNGFIPSIIYGEGKEGIKIALEKISFIKQYRKSLGQLAFFDIDVEGKKYTTIIKEKQIHPVNRDFLHIDFVELHKGKKVTFSIPITYTGTPVGVSKGGILEILERELDITCLPKEIPEEIKVNISHLDIDDTCHFSEITGLENLETHFSPDAPLATIKLPKKEIEPEKVEEEIAEEGEEGAEVAEEETSETENPDSE